MTQEDFLRLYDVRNIWNYTLDEGRCHNGTAPTIRDCVRDFGRETVRSVVRQHLDLFIDFLKAKDKPSNKQRDTIVWFVLSQFSGLKITEFQLYIIKAMSGAFGKFYNTLDPLDVTTSLRQWVKECEVKLALSKVIYLVGMLMVMLKAITLLLQVVLLKAI